MLPWLITSFGLAAGRQLVLTMLAVRHHWPACSATLFLVTAVASGAALQVHRRSTSRKGSPS